jgi:type II secretion system protein H
VVNRRSSGFTLLELLVVVLIMAIIAGMVVPMVSSSQDADCAAAARALVSDLELAQSTAIARQANVALVFSADLQSYKVALADSQNLDNYASVAPLPSPSQPTRGYEVRPAADLGLRRFAVQSADFGGDPYVVFDSFGSPEFGGTVVLKAGDATLTVTVEAVTGAVTVK